jgi:uncharacterized UPF0160 family protein
MPKIITHNGNFHADDVFAVAALKILFEKRGIDWGDVEIIRTRKKEIIDSANSENGDFVLDVGDVYDPAKNLFDHHQGDAGERGNAVPYAALGLIWKNFGTEICDGDKKVADLVDEKIVQTVDISDTGHDEIMTPKGFRIYDLDKMVKSFIPTRKEDYKHEKTGFAYIDEFKIVVSIAKNILKNEIEKAELNIEDEVLAEKIYNETEDKRLIVLDDPISWQRVYCNKPEPIYVIHPKYVQGYAVRCVPKEIGSYDHRKFLPESWRAKRGEELEKITGVKGAEFCHKTGFLAGAKTKEAAIEMAKIAVNA